MSISTSSRQSKFCMFILMVALLSNSTFLMAQTYREYFRCDSLFKLNKDIFIESYYFSKVLQYDISQRNIEGFFNRDNEKLDLESLDSLLRSGINSQVVCKNLNAKQFKVLFQFYKKDYELDNFLAVHQIEFEILMAYLYHNELYRRLVTKYLQDPRQTADSLSETQMRVVLYNFVCYLILHNINVKSLNIK